MDARGHPDLDEPAAPDDGAVDANERAVADSPADDGDEGADDPAVAVDAADEPTEDAADEAGDGGAPTLADRVVDAVPAHPAASVLALAIALWCLVFGRLIWQRHAVYATFDFDLGHHDQAIWLLAHGKGFITVSGMPVLGHHFTLAYFAVAPLYWLGGGPQLLDLLQTAALGLSAVPIYLYARDRLGEQWQALVLGLVWLLNPSVQWILWEAWHPETMAIPFFLTAYLMASRRRWAWYWVFLVATLSWKEDYALAVIVLGIVLVIRRERRVGLVTVAVGAAWFVVAYLVVMRHLNGGMNHAGLFYGELGEGPIDIVRTGVTDPTAIWRRLDANDALGYGRDLVAPFGFVGLLAPLTLLLAVPQFFANALTNQSFFYDIRFHYVAIIVATLALATVEGVARFRRPALRRGALGVVAACALAGSVAWGMSPISTQYRAGYWPLTGNPRQAVLDRAVARVPDGASVAASYYIVPHLSHREQIYTFPNPWIAANWGVAGHAPHDPRHDHVPAEVDWLVLDTTTHTTGGREEALLDRVLANGEFEVVSDDQGILVAERVAPPPEDRGPRLRQEAGRSGRSAATT